MRWRSRRGRSTRCWRWLRLARETGVCLIVAFAVVQLRRRNWRGASLAAAAALPFCAWMLFLHSRTAPDYTVFASCIPLKGLVLRTLQPLQYATTSAWLRKAAALDYLAILGIWAALIASPVELVFIRRTGGRRAGIRRHGRFPGAAAGLGRSLLVRPHDVAAAAVRGAGGRSAGGAGGLSRRMAMVLPRILLQLATAVARHRARYFISQSLTRILKRMRSRH